MNKKEERRNNILLGAFKLFMSKEYANVTTSDVEEVTGVSRGAIYYKVKNKDGLYRAVIDKFVFNLIVDSLNRDISVSQKTPFWDFIMNELELIRSRMSLIRKSNIDATAAQYLNLLSSACFHYKGVKAGELKKDADPDLAISTFRSLYYGDAFSLSIIGGELDIESLKRKYLLLYNTIRL